MASKDQGVVDATPAAPPLDPQVANEAAEKLEEAPKAKPGWVRNIQTDTLHEVEDTLAVYAAYPGQYEKADKPGANSKKIGWGEDEPAAE